ncbi:MAG: Imm8 family immunity protein [Candidatus Xenobia bacterium]
MKAELKSLGSIQLDRGELPSDPEDCAIRMTAAVGELGDEAADNFDFTVVTPRSLARELSEGPHYLLGRHLVIVERFDWDLVEAAIRSVVEREEAPTWEELAARIGRHGEWEYEDYQEASPSA